MDKATKVAVEKYPHGTFDGELGDSLRAACAVGYMQAEKDLLQSGKVLSQEHHQSIMETLSESYQKDVDDAFKCADKVQWRDGYDKALKDIIALIESRLSELLGDAQPTPILRYELLDLVKKIKEE